MVQALPQKEKTRANNTVPLASKIRLHAIFQGF